MTQLLLSLQTWLASRHADERGATAVEYGLMVSLIAVVIIVSVTALGVNISGKFTDAATAIANAG